MSYLLELIGKGLESQLMDLVLPYSNPLTEQEITMLSNSLKDDPAHAANTLRLAIHHIQSGATTKAETMLTDLLNEQPGYIEAQLALGSMFAGISELDQAVEHLSAAHQTCPKEARVLFSLGYCYERQGNLEQALEFYKHACDSSPYMRKPRQRTAAIYLKLQNIDQTIHHCQLLQKEHPEDVWTYLVLGQLALMTKNYKEAEHQFERALTIEPDNFELHDDQVESLAKAGNIHEAIERMQEIIEQQGEFPDSYVRLADLYSQLGDDDSAVNNYERALDFHPGYLEAAVKLGTQHLRMGRHYDAAVKFNLAIEINDQLIGAYVGLATSQKHLGKKDLAKDTFELAMALEPNTNLMFAEMNRLQLKVAKGSKAANPMNFGSTPDHMKEEEDILKIQMARYQHKLKKHNNHADLHYNYGLLLHNKGETDECIKHYQTALEVNPSFFKAQIKLGLAMREINQIEESEKQFDTAFDLPYEYVDLHYQLGIMFCDKIKFALAVEHYESEIGGSSYNAQSTDIQTNLSLALQNMGLVDRVAAAWRAVCELEPQSLMAFKSQRSIPKIKSHTL